MVRIIEPVNRSSPMEIDSWKIGLDVAVTIFMPWNFYTVEGCHEL